MPRNTAISLDDHFDAFIDAQIEQGRFNSASDVVRAGLRLLEDRETQVAALRAALIAGEMSGAAEPFDFDAFIADKHTGLAPTPVTPSTPPPNTPPDGRLSP